MSRNARLIAAAGKAFVETLDAAQGITAEERKDREITRIKELYVNGYIEVEEMERRLEAYYPTARRKDEPVKFLLALARRIFGKPPKDGPGWLG